MLTSAQKRARQDLEMALDCDAPIEVRHAAIRRVVKRGDDLSPEDLKRLVLAACDLQDEARDMLDNPPEGE